MIRPIVTSRPLVYSDGLFLIVVTIILAIFVTDLELTRLEGGFMTALLLLYLAFLFLRRSEPVDGQEVATGEPGEGSLKRDFVLIAVGLASVDELLNKAVPESIPRAARLKSEGIVDCN